MGKPNIDLRRAKILCQLSANERLNLIAEGFLANPHEIWLLDNLKYKRAVLKLASTEPLHYN